MIAVIALSSHVWARHLQLKSLEMDSCDLFHVDAWGAFVLFIVSRIDSRKVNHGKKRERERERN